MKRARRTFSTEFKRRVVEEFLGGHVSQAQLCRQHELSPTMLREWRRKYEAGEYDGPDPTAVTQRKRELEQRIAELERKIGQLTMENEVLQKRGLLPRRRSAASGLIVSGPRTSASRDEGDWRVEVVEGLDGTVRLGGVGGTAPRPGPDVLLALSDVYERVSEGW